eukprot:2964617-Amphidinium_carterae.1
MSWFPISHTDNHAGFHISHAEIASHERHPELLPRQPNLKISILGARGLPPADTNGKSDPYCAFSVQGKPRSQGRTRHVDKTLDPWWGEESTPQQLSSAVVH